MADAQAEPFDLGNEELLRTTLRLVRLTAGLPAIPGLLPALSMLIVLVVGGAEVAAGRMTVGAFFTFAMFIWELTFPTFIMGWVVALVQRGAASMQRIDELLSIEPTIADRPDVAPVDALAGEIEFRNLQFSYPGSGREPALGDLSLHVPAGTALGGGGRLTWDGWEHPATVPGSPGFEVSSRQGRLYRLAPNTAVDGEYLTDPRGRPIPDFRVARYLTDRRRNGKIAFVPWSSSQRSNRRVDKISKKPLQSALGRTLFANEVEYRIGTGWVQSGDERCDNQHEVVVGPHIGEPAQLIDRTGFIRKRSRNSSLSEPRKRS